MNQKSKVTIGIISGVVIAAVILGYTYVHTSTEPLTQQETLDEEKIIRSPPPLPLAVYGTPIDLAEAKTILPYHIPTINNPPEGVTLKRVTASPVSKTFVLMYSSAEIPENATREDLWFNLKGILVTGETIPPNINEKNALQAFIAANPNPGVRKLIAVNGIEAAGVERNPEIGLPSYINLYINNARYNISADIPLVDLIKITESMDFHPSPLK
jgi:hypothetical protein